MTSCPHNNLHYTRYHLSVKLLNLRFESRWETYWLKIKHTISDDLLLYINDSYHPNQALPKAFVFRFKEKIFVFIWQSSWNISLVTDGIKSDSDDACQHHQTVSHQSRTGVRAIPVGKFDFLYG